MRRREDDAHFYALHVFSFVYFGECAIMYVLALDRRSPHPPKSVRHTRMLPGLASTTHTQCVCALEDAWAQPMGATMYEHIIMWYLLLEDLAMIRGDFEEFYLLDEIALRYCMLQDCVA